MENSKIKWLVVASGAVLVLLVILVSLHKGGGPGGPLGQINYTNSISGEPATFYADKGLEVQSTGPAFANITTLSNLLNDSEFTGTLTALKQFVNTQSHFESRNPVIADVHKESSDIRFTLFIDSSEQFYDVSLKFTGQQVPVLTYKADEYARI